VDAFWTAPAARRGGLGRRLASYVVARHPGPWAIAFQHDNAPAGAFWRRAATELFGPEGEAWTEEQRPVPGKPEVPPDHWIETRL
jgi:predicted acetyltransferase